MQDKRKQIFVYTEISRCGHVMAYTAMGKTAGSTIVQQTVIETLQEK